MKKLLLFAVIPLLAAACSKAPQPSKQAQSPVSQNGNATTTCPRPNDAELGELRQTGNELYGYNVTNSCFDVELGQYENGVFALKIGTSTAFSFPGEIKKLQQTYWIDNPVFSYDGITISDHLAQPNSGYQTTSVTYVCGSSFLKESLLQNQKYYCRTNSKDEISQYELTAADGVGFGTGDEAAYAWKKLYAKRINGRDVFLVVPLVGTGTDNSAMTILQHAQQDPNYCNDSESKFGEAFSGVSACQQFVSEHAKVPTKAYLDKLLKNPDNEQLLLKADTLFGSLTKAGE